jgi:hypothetical protein
VSSSRQDRQSSLKRKRLTEENARRHALLFPRYNPLTGLGSPTPRRRVVMETQTGETPILLPESLTETLGITDSIRLMSVHSLREFYQHRFKHDFEFWAATCIQIVDKNTKEYVPFILRPAQRVLLAELERQRLAGVPIRIILAKARQWGGSTLVEIYMMWIQLFWHENWHSTIVTQVEDQARRVRGIYADALSKYPKEVNRYSLRPYEGSAKNKIIPERGCIVSIGSAEKPDSLRSNDFAMLHLSEVGLWKATQGKKPEDLVQTLDGSLPFLPDTLRVKESTGKGVGNYFHREWVSAKNGESNDVPVFVPFWKIELYMIPLSTDPLTFYDSLNEEERLLWERGATLEAVNWRRTAIRNFKDKWRFQAEFPSTDEEIFQATGARVFHPGYTFRARETCRPAYQIGELNALSATGAKALEGIEFAPQPDGNLRIWKMPNDPPSDVPIRGRYALFADIGGRTEKADFSVIRVVDRYWMAEGGVPEAVATWRGHLDQDLFAWKCAQLAKFYDDGLLAIEVNSLRTKNAEGEGEHSFTVLDQIKDHYANLFTRTKPEQVRDGIPLQYGFHTNTSTKEMILDTLNAALRDGAYWERDERVIDECDTYERKEDGTAGAVDGCKDDLVIATAGVLWLALEHMDRITVEKARKPAGKKGAMAEF